MSLMGPIRSTSLCKTPVITVKERISVNTEEGEGKGRTYITVGGPGRVIWLSVNLAIKSPDPNEHGGGHVLWLEWKDLGNFKSRGAAWLLSRV